MHLQSPWIFREISFVNITLWFWDSHRIMFSRSPQSARTNGKFRLTRWKRHAAWSLCSNVAQSSNQEPVNRVPGQVSFEIFSKLVFLPRASYHEEFPRYRISHKKCHESYRICLVMEESVKIHQLSPKTNESAQRKFAPWFQLEFQFPMVPNCIGTRIGNKLVEVLNLFCVSGTHLIFYTENVFLNAFYRMVNGNDRSPPQAPPENKNRVGFSRKHYFFQRLRRFLCKKYQENLLFLKWIKIFKKPLKWINPRWDPPTPRGGSVRTPKSQEILSI